MTATYPVRNFKPPLHTLCSLHRNSLGNQGTTFAPRALGYVVTFNRSFRLICSRPRPPDPVLRFLGIPFLRSDRTSPEDTMTDKGLLEALSDDDTHFAGDLAGEQPLAVQG
jgi:hypothetical protein